MMRHLLVVGVLLGVFLGQLFIAANPDFDDKEMPTEPMPRVSTGILRRAKSCNANEKIEEGAFVKIDVRLFTDEGKDKRVEVFHSDDKFIPGVGRFLTLPGLEMGLLGACAGEVRSIRIPAPLGYADMGSKKLNIPPNTALRATVEVKSFHIPTTEEEESHSLHVDPDLGIEAPNGNDPYTDKEGAQAGDAPFPEEVMQLNDDNFDTETAGKHAFVLVYAPWCHHCVDFKPAFAKVAKTFAAEADIAVVAVDGTANAGISKRFEVQGFPTILLRKVNGDIVPFEGPRNAASVVAFINKQLDKTVSLVESA